MWLGIGNIYLTCRGGPNAIPAFQNTEDNEIPEYSLQTGYKIASSQQGY
jgi:hypothetical protein